MKTLILFLFAFFSLTKLSFSQCDVNVTGGDFFWCNPCEGTAYANATGGTAPYTYSWSTGDTTAFINNLCTGNYVVTITDDLGCAATDIVTINQTGTPMTVSISSTAASSPTTCDACITVSITGGCVPYNLIWDSPGDPTWPLCSACPFETYSLTVTDNCGCSITDSVTTDSVTVGLESTSLKNRIGIYPNPSSDFIIIEVSNHTSTETLTITDIHGNTILTTLISEKINTIRTDNFTAGIYFINVSSNGQILQTEKWIKQ